MNKRIITILMVFILLILQFIVLTPNVYAECYGTISGNNYTIDYNDDNTKITSITINFSYIDNVNLVGKDNSKRQYNLIFTKDASKKSVTTAGQARTSLKNLSTKLGITDAIYSAASIVGQSGVTYTGKSYSEGDALCGTSIKKSKDNNCTLINGTYTITDRSVLAKFEPNTIYYGLLCSGFSDGSAAWYTNVSIDVQINENKAFIILDENQKPVITVNNNHNPVQDGDILTASSNADEITYGWYYDDNDDGIPDDETFLGSGTTYTVKCPDANDPTHDDTGHKIICVATQNKNENGTELSDDAKLRQTSLSVAVKPIEKGEVKVVNPTILNENNAQIDETVQSVISKVTLTDAESAAIDNGKNVEIYLEVKDISDSVSAEDKEKIEEKLIENQKIGMYLDVNLFKKVEGQEATKVTKTLQPVKISFEIPKELLNTDSNIKRTFVVLRLHDGVVTEIEVEVNGTTGTFETDEFSTYALTYKDEKVKTAETTDTISSNSKKAETTDTASSNKKTAEITDTTTSSNQKTAETTNTTSSNPKTGDNIAIWISLMVISTLGVAGTVKFVKK